jgi:FKBP12-rapamycin complex-associated protein
VSQPVNTRNDDFRARAGLELKDLVATTSREVTVETFSKFSNDINKRIFELIHSSDVNDKLGGICAIGKFAGRFANILDCLIDLDSEENTKVTRFANYLRSVIPGIEPQISVMAANALGDFNFNLQDILLLLLQL